MCRRTSNDRAHKPKNILKEVSINDINNGRNPKKYDNKACKGSTNASASTAVSLQADTLVLTEKAIAANTASAATEYELSQRTGKLILDIAHCDNAKVNTALKVVNNLSSDKKKSNV